MSAMRMKRMRMMRKMTTLRFMVVVAERAKLWLRGGGVWWFARLEMDVL
jgi:hypothetical protein